MGSLLNYFWKSLPDYFHLNDTYKDKDPVTKPDEGRGFLQRYLLAFQEESQTYVTDIDDLYKQIFPELTELKYLDYIAGLYGYPPDTFGDTDWYRLVLANIILINQVKGTEEGIYRYWGCMGVDDSDILILIEFQLPVNYDDGVSYYDDGTSLYDATCFPCAYVTLSIGLSASPIVFAPLAGVITDNIKRNVQSILAYLLPVNTILRDFQYNQVSVDIDLGDENIIIIE